MVAFVLSVVVLTIPVRGQSDSAPIVPGAAATSTDVYGNAQFGLPERRPLGLFRFDRGGGSRGGSIVSQNRNRRGGGTLFSLPGDLLGLSTMTTLANTISPSVLATVPRKRVEAFYHYGGFGTRYRDQFQDPISAAFSRRASLMDATSEAAPVYRALAENSSMAGIRTAVIQTPFVQSDDASPLDSPISLFQRLDARTESIYARAQSEAWALFREGAYRPASRAFEAVLVLSSDDLSARIGEVFCFVNIGSIRTAMAIVSDIQTHSKNIFSADLDMASKFGDVRFADQLATDARLALESVGQGRSVDLDATYILVLWYLRRQEDAERFARLLPRREGAANYADWPAKMRAVKGVPRSSGGPS